MVFSDPARRIGQTLLISLGLLVIPLTFTLTNPDASLRGGTGGGFDWGLEDFAAMGLLLMCVGIAAQIALKVLKTPEARVLAILLTVFAGVLVWAELAVDAVSQVVAHLG